MTNSDIATIARSAAIRLSGNANGTLVFEVDAVLSSPASDMFLTRSDAIALASLIVAIAQSAWTAYQDLKTDDSPPPPLVIERHIRVEMQGVPGVDNQLIQVVVEETLRQAGGGQ
ncbi:MAG: hypothetical protein K2X44_05665 [Magnetospirillum sp.]|nr:hypothetical protein [Magnetospirillum sp.]